MIQSQYSPNSYVGNGSQTTFPFNFRILAKPHLVVTVSGVLKALNIDYTIADQYVDNPSGGQLVFIVAPPNTAPILLSRNTELTQLDSFVEGGPFPAAVMEEALDKITLQQQEQSVAIGTGGGGGGGGGGGTGLTLVARVAITQHATTYTIAHNLNNPSAYLVMAFVNWNAGAPFIVTQDANNIIIAWQNECPYTVGGSLQWGVL